MTGSLRDRARSAQRPPAADADPFGPDTTAADTTPASPEPLETVNYGPHPDDWLQVSVETAWNRVMVDVQSVPKSDRMDQPGQRWNYRGIDLVLNAVGPALRKHGVVVLPVAVDASYESGHTARGNAMRTWNVTVRYEIRGPMGDTMPGSAAGEANDTSDKGTTKALSVAYRNFLIAALCLPTNDPRLDPEATHIERGERPLPDPHDYFDEMTSTRTNGDPVVSVGRLQQIRHELRQHPDIASATFQVGDEKITLWELNTRLGRQLQGGGS
jgi:ERF superfamily